MKRIVCEMCGCTEWLKNEGVFVCQGCGIKYSVEEAKKLMVECDDEGQKAVQVGNSKKLQNMRINAKRAFEDGQYVRAEGLYREILNEEPNDIRAVLYAGLSYGWQGNLVKFYIPQAADAAKRAINIAVSSIESPTEKASLISEIVSGVVSLGSAYIRLCISGTKDEIDRFNKRMNDLNRQLNDIPWGYDSSFLARSADEAKQRMNKNVEENRNTKEAVIVTILDVVELAVNVLVNEKGSSESSMKELRDIVTEFENLSEKTVGKNKAKSIKQKLSKFGGKTQKKTKKESTEQAVGSSGKNKQAKNDDPEVKLRREEEKKRKKEAREKYEKEFAVLKEEKQVKENIRLAQSEIEEIERKYPKKGSKLRKNIIIMGEFLFGIMALVCFYVTIMLAQDGEGEVVALLAMFSIGLVGFFIYMCWGLKQEKQASEKREQYEKVLYDNEEKLEEINRIPSFERWWQMQK